MTNMYDPNHSPSNRLTAPLLTIADAIDAVAGWSDLTAPRRRDLTSALNKTAQLQKAPADEVFLTPETLRTNLLSLSAAVEGIGDGRLRNIQSALRYVLRRFGCIDANAPLTAEWQQLLAPLDHRQRAGVTALAHYCASHAVAPAQVDAAVFTAFADWLEHRTMKTNPTKLAGTARRAWNRFSATIPGWPAQRIEATRDPRQGILPLEAFTQSFQDAIAVFRIRLQQNIFARRHAAAVAKMAAIAAGTGGEASAVITPPWSASSDTSRLQEPSWKPLRANSAGNRADHARWAASALVETGVPIERITSLRDLVQPAAHAEAILQLLYARAGNGPSSRGAHVADVLRIIARHIERAPPEEVAVIVELGMLVRRKYEGLTKKNEDAIARAMRPKCDQAVHELPEALMAAARKELQPSNSRSARPRRAASLALRAMGIMFLLYRPLRLANIIGLHLDRHLQRDDPGRPDIHRVQIQAAETKNNNAIMLSVPPYVNRMLQQWLSVFRPLIAPPGNRYLFPGGGTPDGHITPQGFRDAIRSATRQGAGVALTPHQFRHLAGKRYLGMHPDAMESVRQLLGHKRLETTKNHYIASQVEASAARFDELVTQGPMPPAKLKKAPKKPRGRPRTRGTIAKPTGSPRGKGG